MKIESAEWSSYHLSLEDLIEAWVVAADSVEVIKACIRVKAATEEDLKEFEDNEIG